MSNLFSRSRILIGNDGLQRLSRARVLVVGLGAVGSYAVEALARSGVGYLRLIDDDVIRLSNRNRQLYALEGTEGKPKAWLAQERVLAINPACTVDSHAIRACKSTMDSIFEGHFDAVIDAIDTLCDKVTLMAAAIDAKIPVCVSALGAATRMDPTALRIADLSATTHCPLARVFRKQLLSRGIREGITCVYSVEPPKNERMRPSVSEEETENKNEGLSPMGSLPCMPGIFGLSAAQALISALIAQKSATFVSQTECNLR